MLKELALFLYGVLLTPQFLDLCLVTILQLFLPILKPSSLLEELVDSLVALQ